MIQSVKVPIERAKELAQSIDAEAVIVIAFRGSSFATTSYGKDRKICQAFAKVADFIHDDIAHGVIEIPDVLTDTPDRMVRGEDQAT